jgi:putative tricarboxylic transport membrane protein
MVHRGDLIAGLLLLGLGVVVCARALGLQIGSPTSPQAGFFPFLGGSLLAGLAGVLLVRAALGRGAEAKEFGSLWRPAVLLVALAVYTALLERVGYPVATTGLAAVVLVILETRNALTVALASLLLAVGSYVVFKVWLGVELPPGILAGLA